MYKPGSIRTCFIGLPDSNLTYLPTDDGAANDDGPGGGISLRLLPSLDLERVVVFLCFPFIGIDIHLDFFCLAAFEKCFCMKMKRMDVTRMTHRPI